MNFLVLLADDIGAAEIGCYGNTAHKTPHIDTLAKQSTMFKTAYVTPICSPTRVMVMTGRYSFRTGWYNLIGRPGSPTLADPNYNLGDSELTFADLAKSSGYTTAMAGKWQLTGEHPTLIHDCGFDEYRMWAFMENLPEGVQHSGSWEGKPGVGKTARYWHPSIVENGKHLVTSAEDYGPDLFSDFLVDFMRRNRDRPFLAYYSMNLTHDPYDPIPDLDHPGQKELGGLKNNVEYLDHIVGKMTKAVDDLELTEKNVLKTNALRSTTWFCVIRRQN
ncbi:sulfatase-like hydrolase/transferase [Planctomycetaceae bacterium SH248]